MSEATAPTTEATLLLSLDERLDSVFGPADAADEVGQPSPLKARLAGSSAEPDALARLRAERRAKLAELNAKSRSAVDAKAALRERDASPQACGDRGANESVRHVRRSEEALEGAVFALASQNPELSPQELGNWLREQMADPSAIATSAAKRAVDPEIAALKQANEELRKELTGFIAKQQTVAEQAQERVALEQFAGFAHQNARRRRRWRLAFSSTTASMNFMHSRWAQQKPFPERRASGAPRRDRGSTDGARQDLHGRTCRQPATASDHPRPNPAAAQAPTHVTNSLAQQRSGVVDGSAQLAS